MNENRIVNRHDTRNLITRVFKDVAEIVGSTMGPCGLPVIIQRPMGTKNEVTKDGVTVAEAINLKGYEEQLAVNLIVQAAQEANIRGGDGTTTATVLAAAITEWLNRSESVSERLRLASALKKVPALVYKDIKPYVTSAKELDVLEKVTTISANGDESMANLVAKAMYESNGRARIRVSNDPFLEDNMLNRKNIEILSRTSNLDKVRDYNASIVLLDGEAIDTTFGALDSLSTADHPVFVIVSRIEHGNMTALRRLATKRIYVIALPHAGSITGMILNDISRVLDIPVTAVDTFTKTTPRTSLVSNKLFNVSAGAEIFSIEVTEDRQAAVAELGGELEDLINDKETGRRLGSTASKRYEVISPYVYDIQLAAVTNFEYGERKARAIDCINACRNAYKHGVIPGGGTSSMYVVHVIFNHLEELNLTEDEAAELDSVFSVPFCTIRGNAGLEPFEAMADVSAEGLTKAYNVFTDALEDWDDNYIIDPLEVFISSLNAAIGLATTVATTGGSIVLVERGNIDE